MVQIDLKTEHDPVYFAAVGDVHGHFVKMESALFAWEKQHHRRLNFVLQVGDLEPIRGERDLESVAAPAKYRHLGDFPRIWKEGKGLPRPLILVGGKRPGRLPTPRPRTTRRR